MRWMILLFTLAACASAPKPRTSYAILVNQDDEATQDTAFLFPPIPEWVASPLGPVPVRFVDSIPDVTLPPGSIVLGRFVAMERTIYMWRGVRSRAEQWRVFLHELCHLRHYDYGVRFNDTTIERMCDAFAYGQIAGMLAKRQ